MKRQDEHVPTTLIRDFAYGIAMLEPHELLHFQDCDQCCDSWWRFKVEANREKRDDLSDKKCA